MEQQADTEEPSFPCLAESFSGRNSLDGPGGEETSGSLPPWLRARMASLDLKRSLTEAEFVVEALKLWSQISDEGESKAGMLNAACCLQATPTNWASLPNELASLVFKALDGAHAGQARLVCSRWAQQGFSERLSLSPSLLPQGWAQQFPRLTDLDLEAGPGKHAVTDETLQDLWKLRSLRSLNLHFCIKVHDLSFLSGNSALASLRLDGCFQVGDDGCCALSALPSLTDLDLTCCGRITDNGVAFLKSLHRLRFLRLSWCSKLCGSGLAALSDLPDLRSVCLAGLHKLSNSALQHLPASMEILSLSGCKLIADQGAAHLRSLHHLQELNLSHCGDLTDEGLNSLSGITGLRSLNLADCRQISDTGLKRLAAIPGLEHLDISGCSRVSPAGLKAIVSIPALQNLDLSRCVQVEDEHMSALKISTALSFLNLQGCSGVTSTGLEALASAASNCLHHLIIESSSDLALGAMAMLPGLRHLEVMEASEVTDTGLSALTNLQQLQMLSMDLGEEPLVTAAGLNRLVEAIPGLLVCAAPLRW